MALPINFGESSSKENEMFLDLTPQHEYLKKWIFLFMYETYNVMLNSRRSDSKDADFEINMLK